MAACPALLSAAADESPARGPDAGGKPKFRLGIVTYNIAAQWDLPTILKVLQNVGIPAVDIIDFSYRNWHRLTDVPANCAPEGMEQVARVLTTWMQRVK